MSDAKPNADAETAGNTETPAQSPTLAKSSLAALVLNWRTLAVPLLCFAVWIGWTRWDNIIDWFGSVDGMQDRIAITVASPTVHTRERLLNDRFEQVSWLDRELELTNPPKPTGSASDSTAAATRAGSEKPADQDLFASGPLSATSQLNSQLRYGAGDPRQLFEMMNGFRDVLRAERARAMLDDRHDVDNSTLDLFSFDATVMPRDNARGYAAVEVVLTRAPEDLWPYAEGFEGAKRRLAEQKNADLFNTYVGWLEKVRDLQQSNLATLTQALDQTEVPNGRSDYEAILRVAACSEYLRVHPAAEELEDKRREACRNAMIGTTPHDRDKGGQNGLAEEASRAMKAIDETVVFLAFNMKRSRTENVSAAIWRQVASQLRSIAGSLLRQEGELRQDKEEQAKALQDAANNPSTGARDAAEIASDCLSRSPNEQVDVVLPEIARAVAGAPLAQDQPLPRFPCNQILRNASWRALFAVITGLGKATKNAAPPDLGNTDISEFPTSCLAAMLQEESLVRPTAEQPRNHGAALEQFFKIRVDQVANGCSITVQPKIDTLRPRAGVVNDSCKEEPDTPSILCLLDRLLEGPGYGDRLLEQPATRAYGYSLSPRLRQNVEVKANQNDTAGIGSAGAGFGLGSVRGLEYRGVEPEVVGFARPIPSATKRRILGARFGWLISPRPGKEMTWSVPLEQAQLSAVVALPSWWRSALLQVCSRFVPYKALADVVTDRFWQHGRQCRVEMIRLPGSAADISRRLGVDVLTTPYMDGWNSEHSPVLYAGNTGEPTHLMITGERLWRNTVVTLGGQKADRIEVLPDMVGITATFDCVRKPTSQQPTRSSWTPDQRAGSKPAVKSSAEDHSTMMAPWTSAGMTSVEAASPPPDPPFTAYDVPVIVWTSEGHTRPQNATVVVRTKDAVPPCPAPGGSIPKPPDPAPPTSRAVPPPSTTETPQATVQTDRR